MKIIVLVEMLHGIGHTLTVTGWHSKHNLIFY